MRCYVYILQSQRSGHYYVGSAFDPIHRLQQHDGNAVKATRGKGPWRLASTIPFPTETLARRAEQYLKKQKSRRILEAVIAGTFIWPEDIRPCA